MLDGEAEGHVHVYPPQRRVRVASAILRRMKNMGPQVGKRLLFLSDSTYHMACSVVGHLGPTSIGRGLVAVGTAVEQVTVPDTVMPLAATLVSYLTSQTSRLVLMHKLHIRSFKSYVRLQAVKTSPMGDRAYSRSAALLSKKIEPHTPI